MYHGVTDQGLAIPDWCQVQTERFRHQLEFLNQEYRVLPLHEIIERISGGQPLPERTACLTFDDGFKNFYTTAYPLLARHKMPSTVFLVTSLIESGLPPWPGQVLYAMATTSEANVHMDGIEWALNKGHAGAVVYGKIVDRLKTIPTSRRNNMVAKFLVDLGGKADPDFGGSPRTTMGWKEIEELAASGLVAFESHTHTHVSLSHCAAEEQRQELKTSRDILRERIATRDLFCYPFGDYSNDTQKIASELGYRCGLATEPGLNRPDADLYALRRVGVGAPMTDRMFEMAMLDWYK